jgi:AraC-like DNA-binding protein
MHNRKSISTATSGSGRWFADICEHPPWAKSLGRLVGMCRFNLYRLFEGTGGVARLIQREQLLEARAVLSDPSTKESHLARGPL